MPRQRLIECRCLPAVLAVLAAALVHAPSAAAVATSPPLGSAASFGVLTPGAVSNIGPTVVTGDVGGASGLVFGFPPGVVTGTIHAGDAVAAQALAESPTRRPSRPPKPATPPSRMSAGRSAA